MIFQQCRHPPLTNKDFLYDALLLFFTSFTRAEGILSKEIFMRRIQSSWVSTFVTVISLAARARVWNSSTQVWNGYFTSPWGISAFKQKHRSFVRRLSLFPFQPQFHILSGLVAEIPFSTSTAISIMGHVLPDSYSPGQTLESFVLLKLIKVIHGVGKLFWGEKSCRKISFVSPPAFFYNSRNLAHKNSEIW